MNVAAGAKQLMVELIQAFIGSGLLISSICSLIQPFKFIVLVNGGMTSKMN